MTSRIFFNLLFSLSISGTLLFGFWILFHFIFKKKFSKRFQYYLLLIITARFLIPITADNSLMAWLYSYITSTTLYDKIFGLPISDYGNSSIIISKNTIIGDNVILGSPNPFGHYVFIIWLLFFVIFFIQKITKYHSFIKYIRANWIPVDTPATLDLLSCICEKKNVSTVIELYTNPLVSSPLLFGIRKSYIVLPDENLSEEQLYNILIHEVSHYKNKDLLFKWLVQILVSIHWFNPIVYYLEKVVNDECEYACDESAIHNLTGQQRHEYGNTLITMIKQTGNYNERVASVTLYENTKQIKNRLTAILDSNTHKLSNKILLCLIILLFIFLAIYIGVYYQ
ncbi:M56 family metallopeptidase [Carnobacterium maltaromaticum]|uniref:M56 family metallopeptidase n=1 Tax=Carnobacterium maltaromaticum TaxID=2751 RepID=UPI00191B9DD9|nr:M56 family metallopeptidase [Carnobacterium maltaromaticum]CAD5902689.1 conserved membrane hypothetical protein [Carnobacterium maltaromaticum]